MKALALASLFLVASSLQAFQSPCSADPAAELRIAQTEKELGEWTILRDLIRKGFRGDGVRQPWMDGMRRHGIKQADFAVHFTWEKDEIRNVVIESSYYASQYFSAAAEIKDPEMLERIRADGLEQELRDFALDKARRLLGEENLKTKWGFKRAYGTYYFVLFDDECLPSIDPTPMMCDGDETALMRRMGRGAENSNLLGVDAPVCHDPQDPDSEKRDPKDLIASGVDVNARDHQGTTALMLAAWNGYSEGVKTLLEAGARVNERDHTGRTALSIAGDAETVRLLLLWGAEVNVRDESGETPLMNAAGYPGAFPEFIEPFHTAGAELNARNNQGETALMQAAQHGHSDAVKILLRLGADYTIRSKSGETALSLAIKWGHRDIVQLLKQAGARY